LAAKRSNVDAVIAVHMFGNVCDIASVQDVVRGKPIIEDCAQSLGSKLHGRLTGSFGDISVFSFRSGKYLSVGEGGALFSRHEDLRSRLLQSASSSGTVKHSEEYSHIAKTYLRSKLRSSPWYGLVGYRLWQAYNRTVDYASKSPLVLSRIYRSDFVLALNRLSFLNDAINKRRANADFYCRSLVPELIELAQEAPSTFYNRCQYPLLLPSAGVRDATAKYLYSRGIGSAKPYHDIADIAARVYKYVGDCPASEQVAQKVLVIPNHERLQRSAVQHICRCVNSGLDGVEKANRYQRASQLMRG
jgi:dTDP-4-amino-4,6-dideoxygalactose transaminase